MTQLDPATAVTLVRRIEDGCEEAEAELIERSGRTLRFLSRRFTRDESDAQDLYQETMIVALEKIRRGEVREPERLAGFLRSLAKNLATQRYRRRHVDAERAVDTVADVADESDPDRPEPLGGALDRERARLTRQVLAELTVPRDREVLFRYYLAEQSSDRICRDLQLRPDHFYRVLHRARQRYRHVWHARTEPDGHHVA